jgi:urocanate hydratase
LGGGEKIFISIWEATDLHTPYQEIVINISFGDANAMWQKTYIIQDEKRTCHTTVAINKHTAKEPISLIMEMLSIRSFSSRSGYNGRKSYRFQILQSYVQDIMGPMCFDYGFGPFRWVCASGNRRIYKNRYHRLSTEEMAKNSTEIQQQMQDNIQWIRVRKKIN